MKSKDHSFNLKRIIWLQSIFSENCVKKSLAISPAANLWQYEFIKSLKKLKIECFSVGHNYEPLFPKGKLFVKTQKKDLVKNIKNKSFNYINFPYLRDFLLSKNYYSYLREFPFMKGDIILTYNDSFLSDVVSKLIKEINIPWVSIIADLEKPRNASGYVYLSWDYFQKNTNCKNNIHLDGGIKTDRSIYNVPNKNKIILYAGTIGGHGGLLHLIKAFSNVKDKNVELWICGKGKCKEIQNYVDQDVRIKFLGFVSQKRLEKLCNNADIFINPRENKVNNTNFPSKILFYLSFIKPIISTNSGLSPKYYDIIFLLNDEKIETLTNKIYEVLSLTSSQKKILRNKILNFVMHNSWIIQAQKFKYWINKEIKFNK